MRRLLVLTLLIAVCGCRGSTTPPDWSDDTDWEMPQEVRDEAEVWEEDTSLIDIASSPIDVTQATTDTGAPILPVELFEEMCEQQKDCAFHPTTQACLHEMKGVWHSLTSQGCRDKLVEMLTKCAIGTSDPCIPHNTTQCHDLIATFQSGCMGFAPQGDAAERWSHVCEAYKMKEPKDCDPSVTMEDVIELCEFVGATLKNTDECLEKIDLYLECLPQTQYYCEPGNVIPRPDPKTGCYKEAEPFTFPTGECIEN